MSYDIKGDFDKIPPNSQSPVKFFGSGDRHLKFVSESAGPHPSHPLSADNSVFEQPSFSDYIYVREDDDEGSYLSVESADRSYRAITGNSSSCKIGGITSSSTHRIIYNLIYIYHPKYVEKLHYPPPDNVHFPGPGRYDVRNPKPTQLGITIKSRTKHPQANPPQQVPGPNSYNTSTSFSLVPKSFNVRAVASMRAAEDVYTFPKKPPLSSCPSNHKESVRARKVSNASAGSRRERNIVDASSFLAEKAAAAGGGGGGAALSTPKEPLLSTANSVGSMSQAGAPCRRRRPPKAAVPEGPPVQVSKEEVKSARNFFGDILKTTGGIIQRVDTEDHSSTK